jgi:hypothetical protein
MAKTPGVAKGGKSDGLVELWALDGSIAEAIRADPRYKVTPASGAVASMDTLLRDDGCKVAVEDGARVYFDGGVAYASMRLDGATLVVDFAPPRAMAEYAAVMGHYEALAARPGWLRYRRPATRDPKPDLAAKLGSMIGQAMFERHGPRP